MPLKAPKNTNPFDRLVEIMAQLRSSKGCPWDRKQTHVSLKPYLIEEAYEVFEAIDSKDPQKLKGELGDLLLQAVFHAQLAAEKRDFTIYDVAEAISNKLVVRHPHVYASKAAKVKSAEDQVRKWEDIKRKEKEHASRKSIVDGVPKAMPALSRASRVLSKAGKAKFQWTSRAQAWAKFEEELREFRKAVKHESMAAREEELGDLLMALVNVSRYEKLDPEHALHQGVKKLSRRIQGVEEGARKSGKEIGALKLPEILKLWKEVKKAERKRS
jgi:tetrapyrrole methylase family protein/MazG family protein